MKLISCLLVFLLACPVVLAAPDSKVPLGKECYAKKDAECNGGVCAPLNRREDILCDAELCSLPCKAPTDCPTSELGKAKCVAMGEKKICAYEAWDKKYCGGD